MIVTDSLAVDGGSSKVALSSAMALAATGLRVTVFAATGAADAELATCPGVTIVTTNQGEVLSSSNRVLGALRGLWNRMAERRLSQLLSTLDPQRTIVHVHGWTKALSSSVVAAAVRANFPVVLTLHEYFVGCPTGCLYLHRDRAVCTLRPMSLACITKDCDSRHYAVKAYRVVRQLIQRFVAGVPRNVRHYITVSSFSQGVIAPMLPARHTFYPVANPIDVEYTARATAERNVAFVFVGRLSPEKGGALLAEAAKRAGVKVIFIGDGPERAAIEAANRDAIITGWLDRDGVNAHLRAARAIVVPSLWYETLGLVVLEAAALGIPAVVASGTAPGDLVDAGRSGLLFARGDVADLTAQLLALADDATVERMSRGAHTAFWSSPPTMRAHIERLVGVYEDVLGSPSVALPAALAQ